MNKVLLIDALHINDSGGKILLDFFIDSIENSKIEAFYLLDKRIKNDPLYRSKKNILFLKANPLVRFFFYLKNKERFSKVFCFGNIPPPVKMRAESFTYFHNKLLLVIPTDFNFKTKFKLFLKFKFIKYLSKNTDYWVVQSKLMKNEFLRKMNIEPDNKVLIHPFFPSFKGLIKKNIPRIPFSFLYVSKYHKYKNFENLIRGFKIFYDEFNIGELHLTLVNDNSSIINSINELVLKGYPVINHGFVSRDKLAYLYKSSEFIVYPSFLESFGLGIIEGIENGCKIIAADLPYTYAICEPSISFDPKSSISISNSLKKTLNKKLLNKSIQLAFNDLDALIEKLK